MSKVKPISPNDLPSEPSVPEWVIAEVNNAIQHRWRAEINKAVLEGHSSNRLKEYLPNQLDDLIAVLKDTIIAAQVVKEIAEQNPEVKYTLYSAEDARRKEEESAIARTQSLCTPERVARLRVGGVRAFPDGAKPGYAPKAIAKVGAKEFVVELIETPSGSRFDSRITRIK